VRTLARIVSILLLSATPVAGQSVPVQVGGRPTGMANASASLKDNWALYNNPAGSARLTNASLNFACENRPSLTGANRAAVAGVLPTRAGTFSSGAFKFGDKLYSEQLLSLGYSHSLGLASLGIRVDYIQYRAEGYDPVVGLGITAGTIADITDKLSLGGYVSNVNRPLLPDGTPMPVRMATGFACKPSEKVIVCGELEKDVGFTPTIKVGIEVTPFKKVYIRSGFNLYPGAAYAGFGFNSWRLSFDYSIAYSPSLAYTHQAGLSFSRKKEAKKK